MIQQILLLWALFALGSAIITPILAKSEHRNIIPYVSLFVGCGAYAFILFVSLVGQTAIGWSFTATFALSAAVSITLIAVLVLVNRDDWRLFSVRDYIGVTFNLIAIVITAIFVTRFNYATASNDSYSYMEIGEGLTVTGIMAEWRFLQIWMIAQRPLFYSMFHALSRPMGLDYLWAFTPVYGIMFIPAFFLLTALAIKRAAGVKLSGWIAAAAASLLLFSAPFMIVNLFYINNHMFTSVHFALFFLLGWLAIRSDNHGLGYIAVLALLPAMLMRFENIILVPVFILMFGSAFSSRRFVRNILLLSGFSQLIISLTYYFVLPSDTLGFVNSESMLMACIMAFCVMTSGIAIELFGPVTGIWEKRRESIPHILTGSAGLVVAALFLFHFESTGTAIRTMLWHMLDLKRWGLFWWVILLIVFLLAAVFRGHRLARGNFFAAGIVFFILLTISLSHFRGYPFAIEAGPGGDTGNRMMVHVAPAIAAYLALSRANYLFISDDSVGDDKPAA